MNQKFIISLSVALMLLVPVHAGARSVKADAGAYQNAPTITVKGVVTDAQGEPLPGASVLVKGTSNGTVTDVDGNYTIAAQQGQTIAVSYIGFATQEFTVSKAQQNIALKTDNVLDDVIVVGYGSIKKANLTGAVEAVDSKVFEHRPIANANQMLVGQMPSVEMALLDGAPYRTEVFGIRGDRGSLGNINYSSDGSTLVLIDGVEGDLELINPNDIESVSVLKDAASAAIYGARAASGVILVTTKNPAKGDKVSITYSGNFNIGIPRNLPDLITDGQEYINLAADAYYGFNGKYAKVKQIQSSNTDIGEIRDNINAARAAGKGEVFELGGRWYYNANHNWYDDIYKKSVISHIHNLAIAGSSDKVDYSLSGRFYDYTGLYTGKSDPYKTFNIRGKVAIKATEWLTISENMDFSHDDLRQGISTQGDNVSTVGDAWRTYALPNQTPYNPDGTISRAGAYVLGGLLDDTQYANKVTDSFRTTTSAVASFFNNTFRINADFTYRKKEVNYQKKFHSYDYSDVPGEMTTITTKSGQAIRDKWTWTNYLATNAYLEYENTFGGKHYLKGMVGYNYEKKDIRVAEMRAKGLYSNWGAENAYAFAEGTGDATAEFKSNEITHRRYAGAFFRVNYNFDERFLVEVNGRYDGSSMFSTNYQWAFFPSVSAGWRISQEPWWHVNPKAVSNLKIRASFGELGDAASIAPYGFEEVFEGKTIDNRIVDGQSNVKKYSIPDETNSQYTWARVRTTNIGIDASFLNSRLDLTAEYYIRSMLGMLTPGATYPATFGSDAAKGNNADSRARGWEVSVKWNDTFMLGGKPFHYAIRAALSDSRTFVTRYSANETGTIKTDYREGEELGEIWGFRVNPEHPLFENQNQIDNAFGTGKPYNNPLCKTYTTANVTRVGDLWIQDLNGNGVIDTGEDTASKPGDREIIGNRYARYPFSFGFDFDWNNFFLSISFNGVGHQDYSVQGNSVFWGVFKAANYQTTKFLANNHAIIGTDANGNEYLTNPGCLYPRLATGNQWLSGRSNEFNLYINKYPIDMYTFNIGHINLQNVTFGYTIPKKITRKAKIENLKVYFSAENLWNWSPFYKVAGRDFDATTLIFAGDNDLVFGADTIGGAQYPKLRTYSFGISITL